MRLGSHLVATIVALARALRAAPRIVRTIGAGSRRRRRDRRDARPRHRSGSSRCRSAFAGTGGTHATGSTARVLARWLIEPWAQLGGRGRCSCCSVGIVLGLARRSAALVARRRADLRGSGAVFVFLSARICSQRGTTPATARARAGRAARSSGRRVRGTPVRRRERRATSRTRRTRTRCGFGPDGNGSCSGTRCSTGASAAARSASSLAHEFGHVAHRHLWKGIGWTALVRVPARLVARRGSRGVAAASATPGRCRSRVLVAAPAQRRRSRRRERRVAPLRGRGGLGGAQGDTRPDVARASSSAASSARACSSRTRRPGTTCGWRRTRRSCSGSRWPRPGSEAPQ